MWKGGGGGRENKRDKGNSNVYAQVNRTDAHLTGQSLGFPKNKKKILAPGRNVRVVKKEKSVRVC